MILIPMRLKRNPVTDPGTSKVTTDDQNDSDQHTPAQKSKRRCSPAASSALDDDDDVGLSDSESTHTSFIEKTQQRQAICFAKMMPSTPCLVLARALACSQR
jgi:hypothetical protein